MRLTQKADKEHEHLKMCIGWFELPTKDYHVRIINETPNQMYQKLGQLEDIEEEFGIGLVTLFKLIKAKNVYSYGHANIMKNTGQVDIYDRTITIWNGSCHQSYPLSEYGKSFALTKEELE